MHRTTTGLCMAAALACAVSAGAQTSPATTTSGQQSSRTDSREMMLTGCVARGSDGAFLLTDARVEPSASGASTTTAGSSATTTAGSAAAATGTTGTTAGAPTEPAGSGTGSTTWALTDGSDLEKYVGQKVQVTGRAEEHPVETSTAETSSAGDAHPRGLHVQSIKTISTTCS